MLSDIRALAFDVFGTVVDWRAGVAREAAAVLRPKGYDADFGAFADAWRALYVLAMAKVRSGARRWTILDVLHRENLVEVLRSRGIEDLTEADIDTLNDAWRRLDPWPDVVPALTRLKARFILATLSNGNVALMVAMARRASLPWDVILGAEVARAYKPDPAAYQSALDMLQLRPGECMMVAAHASDLEAAARCGLRTAYVHRPLEFGQARADRPRSPGDFDLRVEDFAELADRLGC